MARRRSRRRRSGVVRTSVRNASSLRCSRRAAAWLVITVPHRMRRQPAGHASLDHWERANPAITTAPATIIAPATQYPAPRTSSHVSSAELIRMAELTPTNRIWVTASRVENRINHRNNPVLVVFRTIASMKIAPPMVRASKASVIPRRRTETNANISSSCATAELLRLERQFAACDVTILGQHLPAARRRNPAPSCDTTEMRVSGKVCSTASGRTSPPGRTRVNRDRLASILALKRSSMRTALPWNCAIGRGYRRESKIA